MSDTQKRDRIALYGKIGLGAAAAFARPSANTWAGMRATASRISRRGIACG